MHWLTLNGRLPWTLIPLLLILALGLALRLHGLNWDSGFAFHPDERDIYMRSGCMFDLLTEASGWESCGYVKDQPLAEPGLPGLGVFLDPERSPLNPHWFPLGSILLYVMVFFRSIIELFADVNALDMRYAGRILSALADTGSIIMVYVLGRRMFGSGVGLLAAAFTAVAVIHVQNSHFYRPETFSVFFSLAAFWAMLRMVEKKRLRDSVLLGLMLGLALAPKVNVLPLVLPLALAYWYRVMDSVDGRWSQITPAVLRLVLGHAAAAALAAAAVFFVTSPYALLDAGAFVGDVLTQARMASNAGMWPFTVQYIDTPPFLYQLQQSSVWGLGLPLGIVAWLSVPFTVLMLFRSRATRRCDLLLLVWVVPTFFLLESFEVRFLRYVFPLAPFLILMASRMLLCLVDWSRGVQPCGPSIAGLFGRLNLRLPGQTLQDRLSSFSNRRPGLPRALSVYGPGFEPRWSWLAVGLVAVVLGSTVFYSLAFQRVYAREHPAVTASQWLNDHVPAGTPIVSDNHWDEFVPGLHRYDTWQFPVYDNDTLEKMDNLALRLARSEYLVFYSHRPYASVARVPERYPLSASYYHRLFDGDLGYRLERTFTSYPQLAGIAFRDDPFGRSGLPRPTPSVPEDLPPVVLDLGYADDNVVGYDHPQVLLFRNVEQLSFSRLRSLLLTPIFAGADASGEELMLSDEQLAAQQAGGTWSHIIDRDGWVNDVPVLVWLLVVELAFLVSLPLCVFIFRPLPDRGIVLARIAGLLGVSYVAWLGVSLGWFDFSRGAVVAGFLVVAGLSCATLLFRWREITGFLRKEWRLLLLGEALFLTAFLAFVGIRAANPDLWHPFLGGEKQMEFAYFNAVIRSTSLPPFDPWFSGGYLNYYYWGYFVPAGLVRLTGIMPSVAFNLAIPLFFALTVTGAYSLVYNLAEGVRRSRAPATPVASSTARRSRPGIWTTRLVSPVGAGLLGALFVAVIGNLDGLVQVLQGAWGRIFRGDSFPTFDFWRSSRMLDVQDRFDPSPLVFWLPDKISGVGDSSFHITEFPFFTFLFGDLHAHMMVIPFTLLVIGLGLNLVVGLRDNGKLWTFAASAALALALGVLWATNSWDYPAYLILVVALLALGVYFKPGSPSSRLLLFVALAAGVFALSLLAWVPYHDYYQTFNAGLDASRWRTPFDRFLGIHGLFLFIIAAFLLYTARRTLAAVAGSRVLLAARIGGDLEPPLMAPFTLLALRVGLGLGLLVAAALAAAGYWTAVVLIVYLMLTGLAAYEVLASRKPERPFESVPLALLALALAIAIGVDFVTVEGDIGRMNTLFKSYLEVWVLLSLAAAYMLWNLLDRGLFGVRLRWLGGAWMAVVVLLVCSSLIYTVWGSKDRVDERFNPIPLTLDGAAYMESAVHHPRGGDGQPPVQLKWDAAAIRWLQDNVSGSPVILEAHNLEYTWSGRISAYTGLPTVLGWPWHQMQQRWDYQDAVFRRAEDVRLIYETTDLDLGLALLRSYGVEYVVVGELERLYYSGVGLQKFEEFTNQGLMRLAYRNQGVSIYQVDGPP